MVVKVLGVFGGAAGGFGGGGADAALALAGFAERHAATLRELDINPLMLRKAGQGAVAADALIRMEETAT